MRKRKQSIALAVLLIAVGFLLPCCRWFSDPVDYRISVVVAPENTSHNYSGSFIITNDGNKSGGETVSWEVYRSDDSTYDVGDPLVEQGTISALSPGASSDDIIFSGTYPLVSGSSDYYFIVQLNASDDANTVNDESVSSQVTFNILFYERFENAYDNAWTTSGFYTLSFDPLSGLLGGMPADASLYALQQTSASANGDIWNNSQKVLFSSDISPSYISFYIRAGQVDRNGGYFMMLGPNPWPGLLSIHMLSSEYFDANGSFVLNQGMYTANTWYKVEIKDIDYSANTFDVYIDGDLDLENKLVIAGMTAFGGIALYNTDDGQFFYDDILIY